MTEQNGVKDAVRQRYAQAALAVKNEGGKASCCPNSGCCTDALQVDLTGGSYTKEELAAIPEKAEAASLGCGNPTALARLNPGETVLDLGSGGGIDVLLSARRVGPTGKAYGLDMTDEMLALARENLAKSDVTNAEFLKGDIEDIPLPDGQIDVIISNCVINLAGDKGRVFREAYRVLKPGGRLAVSDMVFLGDKSLVPEELLRQVELWAGCIAGALTEKEYQEKMTVAGFTDITVEATQVYGEDLLPSDIRATWPASGVQVASAFIRARKP